MQTLHKLEEPNKRDEIALGAAGTGGLFCIYQREVRKTRGSARTGYWKLRGRRRWSTLHRNPPPPQLEYTSYHSWAALSIGWQYGTSFAASTFTGLSKCIQPARQTTALVQHLVIQGLWYLRAAALHTEYTGLYTTTVQGQWGETLYEK
jgi:hypothetical protein